jgi:hypothetical protein
MTVLNPFFFARPHRSAPEHRLDHMPRRSLMGEAGFVQNDAYFQDAAPWHPGGTVAQVGGQSPFPLPLRQARADKGSSQAERTSVPRAV